MAARTDRVFSDADKEFLAGVGGQLGMAIRNAALYRQSLSMTAGAPFDRSNLVEIR